MSLLMAQGAGPCSFWCREQCLVGERARCTSGVVLLPGLVWWSSEAADEKGAFLMLCPGLSVWCMRGSHCR